jgi:hypothetical protein
MFLSYIAKSVISGNGYSTSVLFKDIYSTVAGSIVHNKIIFAIGTCGVGYIIGDLAICDGTQTPNQRSITIGGQAVIVIIHLIERVRLI